MKKKIFTFIITGFLTLAFLGCGGNDKKEVRFADAGWDSNKVHNAVAGYLWCTRQ